MKTRIAIVDSHSALTTTLSDALALDERLVVHGTYSNLADVLDVLMQGADIDVVLSDFTMPLTNGIELLTEVKKIKPEIPCILLTMHDAPELRYRCLRAGIEGYLLKTSSVAEIQKYIHDVAAGRTMYSPNDDASHTDPLPDNVLLSPCELEVVRCVICMELSSKATAEFLNRSHHTIEQHRKNIYAKLGIDGVAALTKYALSAGICNPVEPKVAH